jgi:hypothetical protein
MIVDSCVTLDTKTPPVLDYLRSIGRDPSAAVRLVLATHWHDDHVRGLARILKECSAASFACSAALQPDELIEGIGSLSSSRFIAQTSGVREMQQALQLMAATRRPSAMWALVDRTLWLRESDDHLPCHVYTLAPSDRELLSANQTIAQLLREGERRRVPRPQRNDGSVVLWVQIGTSGLLLGADLEETGESDTGWTAVVNCANRPQGRSQVFKVPHHGSSNAHQDRVWDEMLTSKPHAVLCPWSLGHRYLPTDDDVARICGLSKQLHLTAVPGSRLARPRTVGERWRARYAQRPIGRVTLRCADPRSNPEDWAVIYADGAFAACPPALTDD